MPEEEHQREERAGGDEEGPGEQHTKQLVVVLKMHVKRHNDCKLERGTEVFPSLGR